MKGRSNWWYDDDMTRDDAILQSWYPNKQLF